VFVEQQYRTILVIKMPEKNDIILVHFQEKKVPCALWKIWMFPEWTSAQKSNAKCGEHYYKRCRDADVLQVLPRVVDACAHRFRAARLTRSRSSQFNAQPLGHVIDNGVTLETSSSPRRRRRIDRGDSAAERAPPASTVPSTVRCVYVLGQNRNQKFIWGSVFSRPFHPFPSFPFPLLSPLFPPAPRVIPQIQLRDLGMHCKLPSAQE